MPTLRIVIASTRPGRVGLPVAEWFTGVAEDPPRVRGRAHRPRRGRPAAHSTSPKRPRLQQYAHQHTKDWSASVSRADAFVFVTPEYNHSLPASLKNALDYLSMEWADKPVGLASYGGVSAGLRAATALKPILAALRMVPVVEAVSVPFFTEHIGRRRRVHAQPPARGGRQGDARRAGARRGGPAPAAGRAGVRAGLAETQQRAQLRVGRRR